MADNTDEENLDTPTNIQSENSSGEIILTKGTETITQNQETENMEIHAHDLHKAPGQGWKHYIFEFLMLFFAVFCGFLAENFREHMVEKERGKQYIESFYQDLKTDTTRISTYIDFDNNKLESLSNLNSCYDTLSNNRKATSCLFGVIKSSAFNRPFKITERTLTQLNNAGGFRLLLKEDADSIMAYQKEFSLFADFQQTVFQEAQNNVRSTYNLLINFSASAQMFNPQASGTFGPEFNDNDITAPLLLTEDKVLLNKYFNELLLYYRVTYNHKRSLLTMKEHYIHLMEYLNKKYHLE